MRHPVLPLLPNRVRRNYAGGAWLARWTNNVAESDGNRPEDWLASTTPAINRGMPESANEGIGRTSEPSGKIHYITDLFSCHGDYYLGADHLRRLGPNLGFLAKLLDSSMRLHTQAHPTREFARSRLGSAWGKLECYVILGVRPGYPGDLRLGFQHAPSRDEWREIVANQDIARMDACFEPIPARVGEVWLVPGGMVHALGAGLLLLEVMEPSDLVVRCEFEREGIVVPPEARYMGRDLDFCLDVFDYAEVKEATVRERCVMQPTLLHDTPQFSEACWVPRTKTDCFEIRRFTVHHPLTIEPNGACKLAVVASGSGWIRMPGRSVELFPGSRFLFAANGEPFVIEPSAEEGPLVLWCCQP